MPVNMVIKFNHRLLLGLFLWLLCLIPLAPHPLTTAWGRAILLFAAFVVVPTATEILSQKMPALASGWPLQVQRWQPPAAFLFALAFLFPNGWLATLLVLPWTIITFVYAWLGFGQIIRGAWQNPMGFATSAGMVYLAVAGVWAPMERAGFIPLGFNPEIVFLTIVHFHYAGFALPIMAGLVAARFGNNLLVQINCYIVVAAVGLLALGITFTQLQLGPEWEMASAWLMAVSAALVGAFYLYSAFGKYPPKSRIYWLFAGLSLVSGMVLAALYGSRFEAPLAWLDIPMMRALHGSLNAIGFVGLGLMGELAR